MEFDVGTASKRWRKRWTACTASLDERACYSNSCRCSEKSDQVGLWREDRKHAASLGDSRTGSGLSSIKDEWAKVSAPPTNTGRRSVLPQPCYDFETNGSGPVRSQQERSKWRHCSSSTTEPGFIPFPPLVQARTSSLPSICACSQTPATRSASSNLTMTLSQSPPHCPTNTRNIGQNHLGSG